MKSWHSPQGPGQREGTLAQRPGLRMQGPTVASAQGRGREGGCQGPWALQRSRGCTPLPDPDVFSEAFRSGAGTWLLWKISEKPHFIPASLSPTLPAVLEDGPRPWPFSTFLESRTLEIPKVLPKSAAN